MKRPVISRLSAEQLLHLAHHLETVPNGGHAEWRFDITVDKHPCGTVGCAVGSLPYAFPGLIKFKWECGQIRVGWEEAGNLLFQKHGTGTYYMVHLFQHYSQHAEFPGVGRLDKHTTRERVATHIRKFVEGSDIMEL